MQIGRIIQLIAFVVILIIAFTIFISIPNTNFTTIEDEPEIWAFCGSASISPKAEIGKQLFKSHCASCHAKDMKNHATGPPLINTSDYWENDTLNFLAYLNDTELFIANHRKARIDSLKSAYLSTSHDNNLTLVELRALIDYINFEI